MRIADKTVLKIMHGIGLSCTIRQKTAYRVYNSYKERVGKTFYNLLGRKFSAQHPWEKLVTDVTEFRQPWGRAYFAPVLDLCGNYVVLYSISLSPNIEQQKQMLTKLWDTMPKDVTPILHSDMGWQYQHNEYIDQLKAHGVFQSMSRKGNCLDNACAEGFFGHLKDEFSRGQKWTTFNEFKTGLEAFIKHWNFVRRQTTLKCLTPAEYQSQTRVA